MQQVQTVLQPDDTSAKFLNKKVDGPGEIIVNEQEQQQQVNKQDETFEGKEEEKDYSEGNMNNSDTGAKPDDQNQTLEGLPGTVTDPETGTTTSADVE